MNWGQFCTCFEGIIWLNSKLCSENRDQRGDARPQAWHSIWAATNNRAAPTTAANLLKALYGPTIAHYSHLQQLLRCALKRPWRKSVWNYILCFWRASPLQKARKMFEYEYKQGICKSILKLLYIGIFMHCTLLLSVCKKQLVRKLNNTRQSLALGFEWKPVKWFMSEGTFLKEFSLFFLPWHEINAYSVKDNANS